MIDFVACFGFYWRSSNSDTQVIDANFTLRPLTSYFMRTEDAMWTERKDGGDPDEDV